MHGEIMITTLFNLINNFGENDGIVKRIYLNDISRIDDLYGQEDCLSVAINIEDNALITFWQDVNDIYTKTDYFSSLSEEYQNAIFNQVMADYGTEMDKYTTSQMETIVCNSNHFTSGCYGISTAFQLALKYVKEHDEYRYRELLYMEIKEMGMLDELEDLYQENED